MSEPTTERETCRNCGLPKQRDGIYDGRCAAHRSAGHTVDCLHRTIANLRAALAEATKLREAVDAVEAVYQTPESDAHDVVSEYEQHVRALLRAEVKRG